MTAGLIPDAVQAVVDQIEGIEDPLERTVAVTEAMQQVADVGYVLSGLRMDASRDAIDLYRPSRVAERLGVSRTALYRMAGRTGVPQLDEEQRAELQAALARIHPGLDHRRSVLRARSVVSDMIQGREEADIRRGLLARYLGPSVPELSEQQVEAMLIAIRRAFVAD